jgi:hypothetical protein
LYKSYTFAHGYSSPLGGWGRFDMMMRGFEDLKDLKIKKHFSSSQPQTPKGA